MIDKSNEEVTLERVWYNTPNCIRFIKETVVISSVKAGENSRKLSNNRNQVRGNLCYLYPGIL